MPMPVRNLTGMTFGRLTVLKQVPSTNRGRYATWLCQCACGTLKRVTSSNLRRGQVKSCGCLQREQGPINGRVSRTTHGWSRKNDGTYRTWHHMLERCYDLNNQVYHHYGGRGIRVCKPWHKFENFLASIGPKPPGLSLDRYPDNNGNYEPGNCRWATPKQQANNTRRNRR